MIELILTAGPVFAIMLSPLLVPISSWMFGLVFDRFRAETEPDVVERLAARRRARVETAGRHADESLQAA